MSGDSLSERFLLLPRAEDDSDWDEVLLRAGIRPHTMFLRRLPKLASLTIGVVFVVALIAAGLIGGSLRRAQAAPPGPRHIQRQVPNGTVHWLFAHKPRGQSLAQAHIALLSTTGAHWQPVHFARVIRPDPHSQVKVVLSLIGKRGRNICMTVYLPYSSSGGCAIGLLLKPFNYDISSRMNPNCPSCSNVIVAGVASDDVARMELFLPGRHRSVPLKDNVFLVTLSPSVSAWSLVAYDHSGLVIGRSSPPLSIQTPGQARTPTNPLSGLKVTQVVSGPSSRGPLSTRHENVVAVHQGIHFAVGLRNANLRRKLTVTMTLSGGTLASPILRQQTISVQRTRALPSDSATSSAKSSSPNANNSRLKSPIPSTARPGCAATRSSSRSADPETADRSAGTVGDRACRRFATPPPDERPSASAAGVP